MTSLKSLALIGLVFVSGLFQNVAEANDTGRVHESLEQVRQVVREERAKASASSVYVGDFLKALSSFESHLLPALARYEQAADVELLPQIRKAVDEFYANHQRITNSTTYSPEQKAELIKSAKEQAISILEPLTKKLRGEQIVMLRTALVFGSPAGLQLNAYGICLGDETQERCDTRYAYETAGRRHHILDSFFADWVGGPYVNPTFHLYTPSFGNMIQADCYSRSCMALARTYWSSVCTVLRDGPLSDSFEFKNPSGVPVFTINKYPYFIQQGRGFEAYLGSPKEIVDGIRCEQFLSWTPNDGADKPFEAPRRVEELTPVLNLERAQKIAHATQSLDQSPLSNAGHRYDEKAWWDFYRGVCTLANDRSYLEVRLPDTCLTDNELKKMLGDRNYGLWGKTKLLKFLDEKARTAGFTRQGPL